MKKFMKKYTLLQTALSNWTTKNIKTKAYLIPPGSSGYFYSGNDRVKLVGANLR